MKSDITIRGERLEALERYLQFLIRSSDRDLEMANEFLEKNKMNQSKVFLDSSIDKVNRVDEILYSIKGLGIPYQVDEETGFIEIG